MLFMTSQKDQDARIIIDNTQKDIYILPGYKALRIETAKALIDNLELKHVPAYKDHRYHGIGYSMYVFKENLNKY